MNGQRLLSRMKISVSELRTLVAEAISASPEYMKKERVREQVQDIIVSAVASGQVKSQEDLDDVVKTLQMSINALQAVPFDVYTKLAGSKISK